MIFAARNKPVGVAHLSVVQDSATRRAAPVPLALQAEQLQGAVFYQDVRIPASAFTFAGFRRWTRSPDFPERGRISYIQGIIEVDMNADEIRDHNPLKNEFITRLTNIIDNEDLGFVLSDGVRLVNEAGDVSNEPDLVFATYEAVETGRCKYVESEDGSGRCVALDGTPDLVVEVVSKHSVRKDMFELPKAYFDAGIVEYWVIIPADDGVDFRLLTRGKNEFEAVPAGADGYVYSAILKRSFLMTRSVNRIGKYKYRLLYR